MLTESANRRADGRFVAETETEGSVSVVIPCFNSASWITGAVESALSQSLRAREIVVVDDGSEDDPASVLASYGDVVRVVRQANRGPSAARNRGVRETDGEYVAFLDADDRWPRDFLERQVELLAADPQAGMVFGDMQTVRNGIAEGDSLFQSRGFDETYFGGNPRVVDAFRKLLKINFVGTGTLVIRRRVLQSVGGFPEAVRAAEDAHLWLRVAGSHPILWNPMVCLFRSRHEGNLTNDAEMGVRSWLWVVRDLTREHPELFTKFGVDALDLIAGAEHQLGYYLFFNGRFQEARPHLGASLRRPTLRRILQFFGTFLGPGPVAGARHLKQRVLTTLSGASSL